MKQKRKTSFALTQDGKSYLELLSTKLGVPQNAILEELVRWKAKKEKITLLDRKD